MMASNFFANLTGRGVAVGAVTIPSGLKVETIPEGNERQIEVHDGLDFVVLDSSACYRLPLRYLVHQLKVRLRNHGLVLVRLADENSSAVIHQLLAFGDLEWMTTAESWAVLRLTLKESPRAGGPFVLDPDNKPLRYKIVDALNDALKKNPVVKIGKDRLKHLVYLCWRRA